MVHCYVNLCFHSSTHRPMGVFEFDKFANGSKAVLDAIVMATEKGATSIIGTSQVTPFICVILQSCDTHVIVM